MIERFLKWMKHYGVTVWLIFAVLALAATTSYAAYVNLDINKHVLSTGKGNQAFFSSNYLYLTDYENQTYDTRLISTATNATEHKFRVMVCNHVYGNEELVNLDDIQYTFRVQARPINGSNLPDGITGVTISYYRGESQAQQPLYSGNIAADGEFTYTPSSALPGETATKDFFQFTVSDELKDAVYFIMTATPMEGHLGATNDQKLAAIITLTDNAVTFGWSGQFLDTMLPNQYSGFNYKIHGFGEAQVTLSWDSRVLEISPWFQNDVKGELTHNSETGISSITFEVGGKEEQTQMEGPTAYQTQFYIVDKAAIKNVTSWSDMSEYVTVTYVGTGASDSTQATQQSYG